MEVVIIKVAVIGSRSLIIEDCEKYIPDSVTEIVSGGAKGVDMCARKFAVENGIKLKEFPPDYKKYGKGALLRRNLQIIEYADIIIIFWDGKSRGTNYVIDNAKRLGKEYIVYKTDT